MKYPKSLAERYKVLEDHRKRKELNHFRRRQLAMRDALNHQMELERLTNLMDTQRIPSMRHIEHRRHELQRMVDRVRKGDY